MWSDWSRTIQRRCSLNRNVLDDTRNGQVLCVNVTHSTQTPRWVFFSDLQHHPLPLEQNNGSRRSQTHSPELISIHTTTTTNYNKQTNNNKQITTNKCKYICIYLFQSYYCIILVYKCSYVMPLLIAVAVRQFDDLFMSSFLMDNLVKWPNNFKF